MSLVKWFDERLDWIVAKRTGSPRDIAMYGKKWSTADDPRWQSYFEHFCESPAEIRFMEMMIGEFDLQPREGKLVGRGITLDLQVEIYRYRADFVANDKVVIEIDGAAYHSYPQAAERDRKRDMDLRSLGFEIVRIPAQTVFDHPFDAISRVLQAITASNSTIAAEDPKLGTARKGGPRRHFVKIATVIEAFDRSITCSIETQKALASARTILRTQKFLFETAREHAQAKVEAEEFRSRSSRHAGLFDQSYQEFETSLAEELDASNQAICDVFAEAKQEIATPRR